MNMNPRERMLAAIARQPLDRFPTDMWATPEVLAKLRTHFGSGVDLHAALKLDGFKGAGPAYIGPPLPAMPEGESIDYWGIRSRKMAYDTGVYNETAEPALRDCRTVDDLRRYPWPRVEWFDFSGMPAVLREARKTHAIQCGYMAPFYFHNLLRGLEQSLLDPLEDPEFTHVLVGSISAFFLAYHRAMFEACPGLIDVTQVTDDLGSQTGPMISPALYREFYKPHHARMISLAHEFGVKVMHHDDGSCRAFLPELVDLGIDILNPVQWNCPGMDTAELKAEFGSRICFHGGIENQRILPFGTAAEVRAEVRHCIDTLGSDGTGYIVCSCHAIQPVTPVENIIALFDEAHHYGKR
jgi:uroporphyrinogen decarboxylase